MDLRQDRVDWIDLARDMNQWRALLNKVINLWVPYNIGKFMNGYISAGF
jgi:hypothetical protein